MTFGSDQEDSRKVVVGFQVIKIRYYYLTIMFPVNVLGIVAVDYQYEFTSHVCNKDGTEWVYCCKYRQTVKVKCPARV